MFDLRARNQAIQIMEFKSFLELEPATRPTWSNLGEAHIRNHPQKTDTAPDNARKNPFLQTWQLAVWELRPSLRNMIKTAKKFGTEYQALKPS